MNMIVSIRARAHARAVVMDLRNGVVAQRSIAPSTLAPARRGALRARWSTDPVSGRLECRWTSDEDVPDSCCAAHAMTSIERLAA
ncbi:hypothetical protein [Methylobacterium sp. JK268]